MASSADPAQDEKARRVRSLLSSYYGSAPPSATNGAPPAPPIDTPDFDCDAYVERLVRETPLDALQTRCAEMAGEIRSLDSDMQMLVYENYSKFIVATDTIRRMKSNVEGMEAKMEELRVTVASTAERSEAVNARLGAHRDQVEQLSGVRGLISKLQAVFELPRKMRTCLDRGAVALAVRYYAAAAPLLRKYGDEGAFAAARREADAAAADAADTLRRALADAADAAKRRRDTRAASRARAFAEAENDRAAEENDPAEGNDPAAETSDSYPAVTSVSSDLSASECVELLELLGTPRGALHGEYLSSRRPQLEASVAAAESRASVAVAEPDSGSGSGSSGVSSSSPYSFDASFLEDFGETAAEYLELFPDDRAPLVSLAKELFARYFAAAKRAHAFDGDDGSPPPPPETLARSLASMTEKIEAIHRTCPEVGLGDRAAEVVERAIRGRVDAAFIALEAKLASALDDDDDDGRKGEDHMRGTAAAAAAPRETSSPFILRRFVALSDALLTGVSDALADVRAVLEERPAMVAPWRAEFERAIRARVETVLDAFVARLAADAEGTDASRRADERENVPAGTSPLARAAMGSSSSSSTPARLLSRARLAAFLATDGAAHVARAVESHFPDADAVGDGTGGSFDAERCSVRSAAASSALAAAYVAATGGRLSLMIRRSMQSTDWLDAKEPRDVRPLADFLLDDLAAVEAETAQILEDGGEDGGEPGRGFGSGSGPGPGSDAALRPLSPGKSDAHRVIARGVADVFRGERPRRGEAFVAPEATQASVLAAVTRVALASLVECARGRTFGRAGFHQMTVDLAYLRPRVRRFAGTGDDAKIADALLEEAANAAADRSLDPTPLDPAIVARILDAKRAKARAE